MRGVADALLRRRQAQRLPHRPVEPGPGVGGLRPGALVERAQDHHVGLLQARLVGLPDEDARVRRRAQPDRLLLGEAAIELRIVGRRACPARGLLGAQRGQELARPPRRPRPGTERRARPPPARPCPGPRRPRCGPRPASAGWSWPATRTAASSGARRLAEAAHQLARGLPVVGARRRTPCGRRLPARMSACGLLQRRRDALQPLAEVGRAEGGKLERAPAAAQLARGHAEPAQRVLEERHQRHRLEVASPPPR